MVRLATERRTFFLYALLVVLPAVVFGGLLWHQLDLDHRRQLAEIPTEAKDTASRVLDGIEVELDGLVARESARPFYHYNQDIAEGDETTYVIAYKLSPLLSQRRPDGIKAWFAFDAKERTDALPDFFYGDDDITLETYERRELDRKLVQNDVVNDPDRRPMVNIRDELRLVRETEDVTVRSLPLRLVAINLVS